MAELKQDILNERNRLQEKVAELEARNRASQSLIKDMDRHNANIMRQIRELTSKLDEKSSLINQLGKDLSMCRSERDGLREKRATLTTELEAYRTGFSGALDTIATARVAIVSLQENDD